MPIILLLALINIVLIVHAAKSGRFSPWGFIILMMPGIGALAYVAVELIPAWFGTHQGQQARKSVGRTLDPDKSYRALKDQVELADTIANRTALAEECLARERYGEAGDHYDLILIKPMGDEPEYVLGKARAIFGSGRFAETVALLEELRRRWPDFVSAEGHLLYARALEESGLLSEALEEYQALSGYYPGAEARVRHGLLLRRMGRDGDAKSVLGDVLVQLKRAPKYVRKVEAEWIVQAQKALRA
jgi:hypothetical protein